MSEDFRKDCLSENHSVRSVASVSVKSDWSKGRVPNFSEEKTSSNKSVRSGSHVSSSVSVKSDWSKGRVPNFSEGKTSFNKRLQNETVNSDHETHVNQKSSRNALPSIFQDLENQIIKYVKSELKTFKFIVQKENIQYFVKDFNENRCRIKEAALDLTLYFLREMKQDEAADTLEAELFFINQLKCGLQKKYQCVFEGIAQQGDSTLLKNIYTDLYITQGGSEQVNTEHEVRQIEFVSKRHEAQEIRVECRHLFEASEQDKQIRTVLTKGVTGIGKSVSVQKFVLDWAEGKENQEISFIFPLPFREMNLKEKEKLSLMDLITQFFPETEGLNLTRRNRFKILFILDGLDECRLPLNFAGNETYRDVSSPASLDVLLTNLIKGNLLPSALIWITSRPAAASKIPPDCIDRLTEIRGFNDEQKEEYFRKRLTDENQAKEIIDHIKQSKSLFIMCHIPVFCWISATVLQNILQEKRNNDVKHNQADDASKTLQESNTEDTPKTLTQMYTHFLRFQIQQSRRKYDGENTPDVSWDKDAILSLGKLAFDNLAKNNLVFYDTDLEACGIDVYKASVYSGMCTQIFKEETGIVLGTMYCFVHLSVQEFIAALYAHLFLDINKKSVFDQDSKNRNESMIDLLKTAVDKALESDNGHLDLFLRFVLGLSLQSNRRLLQGLLTQQDDNNWSKWKILQYFIRTIDQQQEHNDQSKEEIVQYIKQKFEANLSPERSINLFYCLSELNDQTLVKEIQTHLSKGSLSSADLSPAQWSALVFVLLTSEEEMEEFELQKFKKSDECLIRLSTVIKTSRRALLSDCYLTDRSCSALATVLRSDTSLKELNMSNNNLQDSGVKLLCAGLKDKCDLELLRLSKCDLTVESCSALASVLRSDSSSLKDLDLSNNNLQDSGVKLLSDGLKDSKLEKLRLSDCSISEEGYKALASALRSNPSHLIELDLRGNDPGQSGVKELTELLQDPHCTLKTLRFLSPAADKFCQFVTGIVGKNPLLLKELNLSDHELGDTRVNQLSALLQDKHCKLNTLILWRCSITEKQCKILASALKSNPSHLRELNLSESKLGDSGVKNLSDLLMEPQFRLENLHLCNCSITEEQCKILTSALKSNPSYLRELDISENQIRNTGVNLLCDVLKDSHCKLETLRLSCCSLTDEGCSAVTSALKSNPSHLRKLNLSWNKLGDSGVKNLSDLLRKHQFKLERLSLYNCSITEEQCVILTSAIKSNPSHLRELNLSENPIRNTGVNLLCDVLKDSHCKLKTLSLSDCSISEEGYKALASALRSNPSHLIELDLRGNDPGQSGVKELTELLQDSRCTLKTLRFLSPSADEACKFVTGIVGKNPLLLKELNLSGHELGDTRVNQLSALLQDKHCAIQTFILCGCNITDKQCMILTSALKSNPSHLRELDLSMNDLGDSGVKNLSDLLMKPQFKLETLQLSNCSISGEGYKALASALRSNPSHLKELDLTGNDLRQSGVKELTDLLKDPNCTLSILRFLSSAADEACKFVTAIVGKNPLLLKELNLSGHELGDTRVNQLSALLQDKHCTINTLILCGCNITGEQCLVLASALKSNPSHLRELNLSGNNIGDSGVKNLSDLVANLQLNLEKLVLSDCSISEEGYKALASALRSNPSHLIELDLRGNDPGQSGVKELTDLLLDSICTLNTLRCFSPAAEEACQFVTGIVGINPLLLKELNLSGQELGDTRVNQLSALLQDKHCQINRFILYRCSITEEQCVVLTSALKSNPSHLRELNLSQNELGDSGVENLSDLLMKPQFKLEKLNLCSCRITEEQCEILTSALKSNPSYLRELDLSMNQIENTGVNLLCDVLKDSRCKLEKLSLFGCGITDVSSLTQCLTNTNALQFLKELDLSFNYIGELNQCLTDVIRNSDCELR
ncbi:protein NLRC3-like [Danio aesculapii]|uniref:protein NLRC3-like n=1 Tax=Danio aesculapii TaxID=1142201 RepID=UPI0024C09BE7|nr:protein NLRC3-like [Danio aesculapii]